MATTPQLGRLRRFLDRPLFGTVVLPFGARVDPAGFPEDEFPLHCQGCQYELRGLSEPRCPECGKPFDRGRLLVVEYAESPTRRPISSRDQRVLLWLSVAAIVTMLASYTLPLLLFRILTTGGKPTPGAAQMPNAVAQFAWFSGIMNGLQIALFCALIFTVLRIVYRFRRGSARRNRVIAAFRRGATVRTTEARRH